MAIAVGDLLEGRARRRGSHLTTSRRANGPSDGQLVTDLDGPVEVEGAIFALFDRYGRTDFGVGPKILGDRSLAEYSVREVFLRVWRSSGTFDPSRGSFSTWLFGVTCSAALDLHRKRARGVRPVVRPVPDGALRLATAGEPSAGPQEVVDESWSSWRISRALETLDAPHREVIELAYFAGLTQKEISERRGVPQGTVKTRTASAYKTLRKDLAADGTSREEIG
jgi:RNA polymerase sigma-70 factor, ECF subfamily